MVFGLDDADACDRPDEEVAPGRLRAENMEGSLPLPPAEEVDVLRERLERDGDGVVPDINCPCACD